MNFYGARLRVQEIQGIIARGEGHTLAVDDVMLYASSINSAVLYAACTAYKRGGYKTMGEAMQAAAICAATNLRDAEKRLVDVLSDRASPIAAQS